jgi:hypothetical protein
MSSKDVLKMLLTESDNVTHDLFRYMALSSILTGLGLSIYAVLEGQPWNMQSFGIGIGVLLAGVGAALKLKGENESK